MNSEYISDSPEMTVAFGRRIADCTGPGSIIALESELGGGKTVLAKGIASGLGVEDTDTVTSPTFTLVNTYDGNEGIIYHIDLYRIASPGEAVTIGIEEIFESGSTVIIEWAERIEALLPENTFRVRIRILSHEKRHISFLPPETAENV